MAVSVALGVALFVFLLAMIGITVRYHSRRAARADGGDAGSGWFGSYSDGGNCSDGSGSTCGGDGGGGGD